MEDVYYTYACKVCEKETDETVIVKTPKEPTVLPGSFASPEAIAHIMVQKNEISNETGERKAEAQSIIEGMSIAFVTLAENGAIDEVTSSEHAALFADWELSINYIAGNIRHYGDKLYKCIQTHTSQSGWEPDATVSLWKVIGDPTEEYPEWLQPAGAGDGYPVGAKVTHSGQRWVSVYDGENVWEPGVFGWDEKTAS